MDADKKNSPESVLARIRETFGVDSDSELAEKFGVRKQTVSSWYKSGVPLRYAEYCKKNFGTGLDYLYYGETTGVYETRSGYTVDAKSLSDRAKKLSDTQRIAVEKMIEGLTSLMDQFEADNEKSALLREMTERLAKLENRK